MESESIGWRPVGLKLLPVECGGMDSGSEKPVIDVAFWTHVLDKGASKGRVALP